MKHLLRATRHLILSLFLAATTAYAGTNTTESAVKQINGKYVIDVRTEAEWKAGHVEGAVLIPHDQIKARITEVTKDTSAPIALYCRSGHRAGLALKTLKEWGYVNVENLGTLQEARQKLGTP